jgi:hypothetical protein
VSAERYTAVFTGLLSLKNPGEYTYLRMGDDPPGSGHYTVSQGRPPYGELGWEISFFDLPEGCKVWCWIRTERYGTCRVTKPVAGGKYGSIDRPSRRLS